MKHGQIPELRHTFDRVAEGYHRARPTYPPALFADLATLAGLRPGAALVEVGCGTGQATRDLAADGYRVVAVELGPGMADVARRALAEYPDLRVETGAFEGWQPPHRAFDAVFPATAWHWVDPATRYALAADVSRPGGSLAVVTTSHVRPAGGDQFFLQIQDVYEEIGETNGDSAPPLPEDVPDPWSDEIETSGRFERPQVRRYLWEQPYTADGYIALLDTYSGHIAMAPEKRARLDGAVRDLLAARPDGRVRKAYLNWLHVARRR